MHFLPRDKHKTEVEFLTDLLRKNLDNEGMPYIFTLDIYDLNEYARPEYGDIIIYTDEVAYHAA